MAPQPKPTGPVTRTGEAMRFQFDSNQLGQLRAVDSVANLFNGMRQETYTTPVRVLDYDGQFDAVRFFLDPTPGQSPGDCRSVDCDEKIGVRSSSGRFRRGAALQGETRVDGPGEVLAPP